MAPVLPEAANELLQPRFPDDDLPEGAVIDGDALGSSRTESCDVVVIGSGAAGGVAAHVLANAGLDVAILEEGPWLKTRDVREDVHGTFARVMRLQGMQVLQGRSFIPMLQGRCVGGSTLVNSAIAWRVPEDVLADWSARFGLSLTMRALEPHYDALEHDLSVREVPAGVLGENNRLFVDAARARGFEAASMRRYDRGCSGSAMCITACPSAAKQGMSVTYVPWSLRLGRARIFTSCRALRIELHGSRAAAVHALSSGGHSVTLRARHAVVVAASTVQTPNLLRRSGVRSEALGKHFQAHPALAVAARFDQPIRMGFGATQGAESTHFRKTERFKLETISLPPDLAAARIPGVGPELAERLANLSQVAMWGAQMRAEAEGTVREGWGGVDRVTFTMTKNDMRTTRRAVTLLARMLFESGAKEVWPGVFGVPAILRSMDEVQKLEDAPLDPRCYSFIATHLFGAARMGRDPSSSVVDRDFAVHGTSGLYVVDSSVFPTNLGVNPQHTIMAMSRLAAERVAARVTRPRAA
jgi:choline dehydrogenase-like flavoprotein